MLRQTLGALRALPAIARAAWRVARLERRALPEMIAGLREARVRRAPDPRLVLPLVERLLPLLPPYGAGRCMKRSLLLLDLWSRAGLLPRFHLGIRASGPERDGHAWVTTGEDALETYRPPDVIEAWSA